LLLSCSRSAPKGLKHEAVVDHAADGASELTEDQRVEAPIGVQRHDEVEEALQPVTLGLADADLAGASGVEGNPQENELGVGVRRLSLGPCGPPDRAMQANPRRLVLITRVCLEPRLERDGGDSVLCSWHLLLPLHRRRLV